MQLSFLKRIAPAILFCLAATCLFSQGVLRGNDSFGRPYFSTTGILKPLIHPSVPKAAGEELAKAIVAGAGAKGNWNFLPYSLVSKEQMDDAAAIAQAGATKQELRHYYFWASTGCQNLLRVEINSWEMAIDQDSVFAQDGKTFQKMVNSKFGTANVTVRLTDVATSKILIYNNFDLKATTKGYQGEPGQPDSIRVMRQLNRAAAEMGGSLLRDYLAGTAVVTGIFEEEKEKARIVLVNDAPATAYCKKGDAFNVYALQKMYEVEGQQFPHGEQVGRVTKMQDYNYKVPKFEVESGKKDIAEQLKLGATLVCAKGAFPLAAFQPSAARTSLAVEDFKNYSQIPARHLRILQDACIEKMAQYPQLLDVVDRDIYEQIRKEQNLQHRTLSDATQGGIGIGGDLLLTAELATVFQFQDIEYEYKKVEKPTKPADPQAKKETQPKQTTPQKQPAEKKETPPQQADPKKPAEKTDPKKGDEKKETPKVETETVKVPKFRVYKTDAALNVKAISVATGEVVFTNTYQISGEAKMPFADKSKSDVARGKEESFRILSANVASRLWLDLFYHLTPRLYLLEIAESNKGEAKKVILGGGAKAGFLYGHNLEVVEVVEEMVEEKKLTRDAVIGELKVNELHPATTVCKVKEGGEEILQKMNSGAKLYCRLIKGRYFPD